MTNTRRKTQLCHTLCVTAQLAEGDGGASGKSTFNTRQTTHEMLYASKLVCRTKLCVKIFVSAPAVIVVDTEGSFRVERVAEIAETRFGLNPDSVLDNILIARVYTHGTF